MNKQPIGGGIEWTRFFGPGTGFTVNPVRGCEHDCKWRMPDGTIVPCYAKSQRERMDGPGSFEKISFHPEVFEGIRARRKPAGIFIDSMSDLLGNHVEAQWIQRVIQQIHASPQHIFFVLTKNPRRMVEFEWPDNVLLGLSAPPTFMYGREMTPQQQIIWFDKGCEWLSDASAKWKWLSLEPLSIELVDLILHYIAGFDWAVIGAGSDGKKTYQPDEEIFRNTLGALTVPVFFKGNLDRALAARHGGWREEFPKIEVFNEKELL
jgi:protein gp37